MEHTASLRSEDEYVYEDDGEGDEDDAEPYDERDEDHTEFCTGSSSTGSSPRHKGQSQEYALALSVADGTFRIAEYSEVERMMSALLNDVCTLLNVTEDTARLLLCKFKWSKERLVDSYYADQDRVLAAAGADDVLSGSAGSSALRTTEETSSSSETGIACPICGDCFVVQDLLAIACGHQFCRNCYASYIASKVEEGPSCVHMTCPMFRCKRIVPQSILSNVADPIVAKKYRMFLTRNFIETSRNIRWCPGSGCDKVAIASGVTTVICTCGVPFCFKCGEEAHDPVSCVHLADWQLKCSNESETANWILANTKKCSQCNSRIEKNQGCNHMTCKICKHEFCWICMGSWAEHGQTTGGYYKCNRFEGGPSDGTAAQKAKVELDRYLFYYQRYHAHDRSLKFAAANRKDAEKRMVEIQEAGRSAWIEVQFLRQAVEQVICCRRVLKYTYVHGYFLQDTTQEKRLFEHHQEMLEKHTETLHHYTELPLDAIDRTQVVNLTRIAGKFMDSLLESLKGTYYDDGTDHAVVIPAVARV
jgi:ariadne-1